MKSIAIFRLFSVGFLVCAGPVNAQVPPSSLPIVAPESVDMDSVRLQVVDEIVAEGLRRNKMPGCVVMIGHRNSIVLYKAYGQRQLLPEPKPMVKNTLFDLASLTKPIATASSIMLLAEDGKIDLSKTVATYIPEFAVNGKDTITVQQLLVHSGGLIPDNSLKDYADGPAEAFKRIHELKPYVPPGSKFVYSDVGFIVLAEIVERVSGLTVHEFSQQRIFKPLGMQETGFLPDDKLKARCAPTQQRQDTWMQGEVHDPRAHALGGVAGHAGLFSTAADLARYCQMLISKGTLGNAKIMSPATVAKMTAPVEVSSGVRTSGWDMRSAYSSNRGDFFSRSAFGHGGFTGTSVWIDPQQELFVIFLSNRVHPDGNGSVNSLAGRIGTVAGAAVK